MLVTQKTWNAVDDYIAEEMIPADPALEAALKANRDNGLPAIDVSPAQGKLLNLIVRMNKAKRILEIGTLGGYSTIWMARALPADGKIVTLELDTHHAKVARANIKRAGLSKLVDLHVGPALDSLAMLSGEGAGPFDLIFIDADKPNNPNYLSWAMKLSRPGTVIVCDNVIRDGDVIRKDSPDESIQGARAAFSFIGKDKRLEGTAIQTVGAKGYDGFAIAIVT
jgi:predicted O-methyltransferase YrrM